MQTRHPPLKSYVLALMTILIWSSAYVAIRYATKFYHPGSMALLRLTFATVTITFVYYFYPYKVKPRLLQLLGMMLMGAFGMALYSVTLNEAEKVMTASVASFVMAQTPIFATIVAVLFFRERIKWLGVIGFAISFIGIFLISAGAFAGTKLNANVVYIFIAFFANSVYIIFQKFFLKDFHAIEIITFMIYGALLSLLMFTPELIHDVQHAPQSATLSILYLGVFPSSMAYLFWTMAMNHFPLTRAVSLLYSMPFVVIVLEIILLSEYPEWLAVIGGIVAILGSVLINRNTYHYS